jgi:hypothetical protein
VKYTRDADEEETWVFNFAGERATLLEDDS